MYEIKSAPKKVNKPQPKKKSVDPKEIAVIGAKVFIGIAVIGAIAFGAYKVLHKPPAPIWTNYDEVMSTGDKILHEQTVSVTNISSEDPTNNHPEESMYLSIKKIDGKDAVWFIGTNTDFLCVGTVSQKCSLDITLDGKPAKSYGYDGGTMRTAYIIDATNLIKEIKKSKELKISSKFKRPEMTATEKSNIAMANGGKYVDYVTRTHIFKVEGLDWQ
jgi:hypothetical protein